MKRYCLALDLKDDPALIAEYEQYHTAIWPEIRESILSSGITGMQIYRLANRLFMIMETDDAFSFDKKAEMDAANPNVQEWETLMWKYQQALPQARAGEKWMLMDKIFELYKPQHCMNKIAIITGATSGIGKATAFTFAANKFDLIITGRRKDRLDEIGQELESTHSIRVLTLVLDVQDKAAVFTAFQDLPVEWQAVDVLVNNAGLALGRDLFEEASMDDWETMLDTNVKGLLYVSKAVLPYMIARRQGHIINLGSIAGKQAYEKGNVYCASKAAVHMLSQTMRVDLLKHKIRVTSINPGAAETEFGLVRFKGDEETAKKVYEGYQPLSPDDIAGIIHYCTSLPPHVCINDLDVTCTAQASAFYTFKD